MPIRPVNRLSVPPPLLPLEAGGNVAVAADVAADVAVAAAEIA
jgi:hypothetical protein